VNTDDFFVKVDAKLRKETGIDTDSLKTASTDREFLEQIIARLMPLVASYEAKLKERDIETEVDSRPASLSITLRYKDGNHDDLSIGGVPKSSLIELKTTLIEKGQWFTSSKTYNYSKWQDSFFETRLQKLIENFLLHAVKHGGI